MTYEIDLNNITLDGITQALTVFNQLHQNPFSITAASGSYTLTGGDDDYCVGTLQEVGYFWQGYVSGQMDGDTSVDEDSV